MVGKNRILFNTAGEGDGGGGTGGQPAAPATGGSALTAFASGGQVPPTTGNANPASGAAANQPAGTPPAGSAPAGTAPTDWRSTLPQELQEDASIKKFTDVSSMARAYVNAQKLIGGDKIPVPSKHATEEDWKQVYHKLGLPEKKEDYKVAKKEGSMLDDQFLAQYVDKAYEYGVLPQQAQKLAEWFDEANGQAMTQAQQQYEAKVAQGLEDLKKEWGEGYRKKMVGAFKVAEKFGGPEFVDYLDKTKLGNDVNLIKFLSKFADNAMAEGSIIGADESAPGAMTPAEAQAEVNKIMANRQHPYYLKAHPGHKAAVDEVAQLFAQIKPDARPALKARS